MKTWFYNWSIILHLIDDFAAQNIWTFPRFNVHYDMSEDTCEKSKTLDSKSRGLYILLGIFFPSLRLISLLAPSSHALSLGFLIFLIGPSLYLLTKRRSNNKHPEVIFSYLKSHTSQSHLLSPKQNKGIPAFNGHTRIYNTDLQYWFHSTSENSYPTKLPWF